MKCAFAFFLLLAGGGVLLGDSPKPASRSTQSASLLKDLVAMTRAGSSDADVLAYARAHRAELPPEVSDQNLRWLRDSGVGESVVRYMTAIDVRPSVNGAPEGDSFSSSGEPAFPNAASDGENDERDATIYSGLNSGGGAERYPGSYDASLDYDNGNGYGYDAPFGYGYASNPFNFFVVGVPEGFRRSPRRDRRSGHHGFDAGHGNRDWRGRGESWRDRSPRDRRAGIALTGPRGARRPGFARGFGVARAGRAVGNRGFAVAPGRARGAAGGGGGFGRSNSPGRSGLGHFGGGRAAAGPRGGRGSR